MRQVLRSPKCTELTRSQLRLRNQVGLHQIVTHFVFSLPKTPPPNNYNIRGLFEESKEDRTGFGFGEGREEMQATGPLAMVRLNRNPGPGSYELGNTLHKGDFSMRPRTHYDTNGGRRVPGPGSCTYPLIQTQPPSGSTRRATTSSRSTRAAGSRPSTPRPR